MAVSTRTATLLTESCSASRHTRTSSRCGASSLEHQGLLRRAFRQRGRAQRTHPNVERANAVVYHPARRAPITLRSFGRALEYHVVA
jgi:hypothetical protein